MSMTIIGYQIQGEKKFSIFLRQVLFIFSSPFPALCGILRFKLRLTGYCIITSLKKVLVLCTRPCVSARLLPIWRLRLPRWKLSRK